MLIPRPSRREIVSVGIVSTLILAWGSIPNWAAARAQDGRWAFGGTYVDPQDYAVHIAMLRQGMQGAWAYTLRFTSEPQPAAYIRMFYILLGELNRVLGIPPETLFQVVRWIFGYTALAAIYALARKCFAAEDPSWKWLAFFVGVLGAGLGWLQRMAGWSPGPITPVDYWLIDAYVFWSLSVFPHFAFVLTCLCVAYLCHIEYLDTPRVRLLVTIALCALLVQLVNPIAFIVVDIALLANTIMWSLSRAPDRKQAWLALGAIGVVQLPLLIYNLYVLTQVPPWNQFTQQNLTPSPPPVYYLWGFGLFWPLAVVGTIQALRQKSMVFLSCAAWVFAAFLLAYLPVGIQRRFLLGVTIPFGLLAVRGLAEIVRWMKSHVSWPMPRVSSVALLAGFVFSLTAITIAPAYAIHAESQPSDIFYPRELESAFGWILAHTAPDDLFLSTERTGQLIAQETGRRVFVGHEMETLEFVQKQQQIADFYSGKSPSDILMHSPIQWVIDGPYERALYPMFSPGPSLELVYRNGSLAIYRNLVSAP